MSKYDPLREHLRRFKGDVWRASHREVERVLGFTLPKSARLYPAWWSNESGKGTHSHARSWLDAGWKTEAVDVASGTITFCRVCNTLPIVPTVPPPARNRVTVRKNTASVHTSQPATLWQPPAEPTIYLVSCVAGKRTSASPACDLYTSAWFRKARHFVESANARWYILSAKYGLVAPDRVIEPYEQTLNRMGVYNRREWGERVMEQLADILAPEDQVVVLAGQRYREHMVPELRQRGFSVSVPLARLKIGEQLSWLDRNTPGQPQMERQDPSTTLAQPTETASSFLVRTTHSQAKRHAHLEQFYEIMEALETKLGGKKSLVNCTGGMDWPERGVYFFFQNSEHRKDSGHGLRVVRIGTHALKSGSRTSLWNRLSNHQGSPRSGGGNHRGSIFRLLIGEALIRSEGLNIPTWGIGNDPRQTAQKLGTNRETVKAGEHPLEQRVTNLIGTMPFLWVAIDDSPGPESLRGVIETHSIGLLSNYDKSTLDPPSERWLGFHTSRERVRRSGLWNSNHVDESYDPAFLHVLERLVKNMV